MNCYIYIRLVWFLCKVTILFTVFKLAPVPLTRTQRATAATKYSMHYSPSCPLILEKVYEVKQANKMNNISRTCNTEQQEAQQNTLWRCILGACYQWLSWTISFFCNYVACLHQLWSPVKSLCRFCMNLILALFCLYIDLTKATHYFMHIAILGSQTDSSSFYDNLLVP